jgi:hypothetical protein
LLSLHCIYKSPSLEKMLLSYPSPVAVSIFFPVNFNDCGSVYISVE